MVAGLGSVERRRRRRHGPPVWAGRALRLLSQLRLSLQTAFAALATVSACAIAPLTHANAECEGAPAVKWELLTTAYDRQAEARQRDQRRAGLVRLYLGVDVEGFVVDDIEVFVDGEPWISRQYSALDGQALQKGGWDLVGSDVWTGSQRTLKAIASGRFPNSSTEERFSVAFESRLPEASEAVSLVLSIEGIAQEIPTVETVAPIVATETVPVAGEPLIYGAPDGSGAGASQYKPGTERDPQVRHARFLLDVGDALGAAYALMDAARHEAASKQNAYKMTMAGVQAALSMARGVDATLASADTEAWKETYERIQLALAEDAFHAGRLEEATTRLERVGAKGAIPLGAKASMLRARLALARAQYQQAILALEAIPAKGRTPFEAYNLAIAEILADQTRSGLKGLSAIGALRGEDKAERALRDKANLERALHYFELGRRSEALTAVKSVSLQGPYASRALLATGWMVLADKGPQADGSLASLTRWLTGSANEPSATPSREDMREALRYWDALVQRDMADPVVQSGALASAFVLEQLGLLEQALARYQEAADALWATGRRLQGSLADLRGEAFYSTIAETGDPAHLGRFWSVRGIPDVAASYWLPEVLASTRFQDRLRGYRDLEKLGAQLRAASDAPATQADEQLLTRAKATGGACLAEIRDDLVEAVRHRQRQVKANLARAHLAIARVTEGMIANKGAGG